MARNWHRPLMSALHKAGYCALGRVGHFAGEQLVKNQTYRENVGARIQILCMGLLRRHILHCPHHRAGAGHSVTFQGASQTEVHDGNSTARIAHDVAGFQVTMDNAFPVRRL